MATSSPTRSPMTSGTAAWIAMEPSLRFGRHSCRKPPRLIAPPRPPPPRPPPRAAASSWQLQGTTTSSSTPKTDKIRYDVLGFTRYTTLSYVILGFMRNRLYLFHSELGFIPPLRPQTHIVHGECTTRGLDAAVAAEQPAIRRSRARRHRCRTGGTRGTPSPLACHSR